MKKILLILVSMIIFSLSSYALSDGSYNPHKEVPTDPDQKPQPIPKSNPPPVPPPSGNLDNSGNTKPVGTDSGGGNGP